MVDTAQRASNFDNTQKFVFDIYDDSVMKIAIDVLEKFGNSNRFTLKAKGDLMPSAVSVANIITENIMKGIFIVEKIAIDSDDIKELGKMSSNMEIILVKKT